VVDVTKNDTALFLNNVGIDNVILNNIDTFIDSVDLLDVTLTDTGHCLSSVSFSSVILNDNGTPIFSVGQKVSSTRQ
jgi:hypothetical protein